MSELLASFRALVKQAIRTMDAMPDPDRAAFAPSTAWCLPVLPEPVLAFGYNPQSVIRVKPSAKQITQAEAVFGWLAWLRRHEGEGSIRRLLYWARDSGIWRLAQIEDVSERTIYNRVDRSLNAILTHFGCGEQIKIIDERPSKHPCSFGERSHAGDTQSLEPGKVYIDGIGMMFRGKPWDSGEGQIGRMAHRRGKAAA